VEFEVPVWAGEVNGNGHGKDEVDEDVKME